MRFLWYAMVVLVLLSGCFPAHPDRLRRASRSDGRGSATAAPTDSGPAPVPSTSLLACDTSRYTGSIEGVVLDESAAPVASVQVALRHAQRCSATTDSLGWYRIAGVPPGTYPVEAMRIGYSQEQAPSVIVRPTQSTTVDFHLRVVRTTIAGCETLRASEAERRRALRAGDPLFRPVPRVITPEWALRVFPTCVECCAYYEQRDSLWAVVRHRPDLADAHIRIVEGRAFGDLEQFQAVGRLGETGQERAYDYLIRLLFRLPVGHEMRGDAILALGSGPAPSRRALHTLAGLAPHRHTRGSVPSAARPGEGEQQGSA